VRVEPGQEGGGAAAGRADRQRCARAQGQSLGPSTGPPSSAFCRPPGPTPQELPNRPRHARRRLGPGQAELGLRLGIDGLPSRTGNGDGVLRYLTANLN
jgi:hypothetical protein